MMLIREFQNKQIMVPDTLLDCACMHNSKFFFSPLFFPDGASDHGIQSSYIALIFFSLTILSRSTNGH